MLCHVAHNMRNKIPAYEHDLIAYVRKAARESERWGTEVTMSKRRDQILKVKAELYNLKQELERHEATCCDCQKVEEPT